MLFRSSGCLPTRRGPGDWREPETPPKVRSLQRELYIKAKAEPAFRFFQLSDKVYREDVLHHAYMLSREKRGAPGVDGQTFEDIERKGLREWLEALRRNCRRRPSDLARCVAS